MTKLLLSKTSRLILTWFMCINARNYFQLLHCFNFQPYPYNTRNQTVLLEKCIIYSIMIKPTYIGITIFKHFLPKIKNKQSFKKVKKALETS